MTIGEEVDQAFVVALRDIEQQRGIKKEAAAGGVTRLAETVSFSKMLGATVKKEITHAGKSKPVAAEGKQVMDKPQFHANFNRILSTTRYTDKVDGDVIDAEIAEAAEQRRALLAVDEAKADHALSGAVVTDLAVFRENMERVFADRNPCRGMTSEQSRRADEALVLDRPLGSLVENIPDPLRGRPAMESVTMAEAMAECPNQFIPGCAV